MNRLLILPILFLLSMANLINADGSAAQQDWAALTIAIVRGNNDMVKKLVPNEIAPNAKNEAGLTPLQIAQNAKKRFDDVANYLQSQMKEEHAPKAAQGWTSEHRAVSRELQNYVSSSLEGNIAGAKAALQKAVKSAENIINAAENMQARSPEGITLHQQFQSLAEIVGPQRAFVAEMKNLDDLLSRAPAAPPRPSTPTGDDWHALREALDDGYLPTIKALIPGKIKASDTMPDGQKITTVAFFHKKRHDQIVSYLESQEKEKGVTFGRSHAVTFEKSAETNKFNPEESLSTKR